MSTRQAHALDAIEIGDFLDAQQTGVLSLARDDDSYAIPVSFAYDDDGEDSPAIYFRLGYAPASQKQDYIESTDHATFVVYDQTDAGWHSVVAEGHLEQLSETELDATIREAVDHLDIPFFEVHERPIEDIEFTTVRFQIATMHGIREA